MPFHTRLAAAATLLLLCGATWTAEQAPPRVINPDALLLMDKSALQQDPKHPERYYYIKDRTLLTKYHQVMIDPLVVVTKKTATKWQALVGAKDGKPEQLFLQTMQQALQKRGITVVDQPGEGVLVLRVAVTHVNQEHAGLDPTDILPIKMVFNLTRRMIGKRPYIAKISTMGVLKDSQTDELLAGALGLRQEDKYGADPVSLENFQTWLDSWSETVADQLASVLAPAARELEPPQASAAQ